MENPEQGVDQNTEQNQVNQSVQQPVNPYPNTPVGNYNLAGVNGYPQQNYYQQNIPPYQQYSQNYYPQQQTAPRTVATYNFDSTIPQEFVNQEPYRKKPKKKKKEKSGLSKKAKITKDFHICEGIGGGVFENFEKSSIAYTPSPPI